MTTSPENAVLLHLARYGISFRPIIEKAVLGGASFEHLGRRLIKEELIVSHDLIGEKKSRLPGGYCCYQLTRKGARSVAASESVANPTTPGGFDKKLAILFFCCYGSQPASFLTKKNMTVLIQAKLLGDFCLINAGTEVLSQVIVVSVNTKDFYYCDTVLKSWKLVSRLPGMKPWYEAGRFQYTLLVPNEERGIQIRSKIKSEESSPRLRVECSVVPTITTLHTALKGGEGNV